MNASFDKEVKRLEREVLLKSVDLDDDIEDFNFEFDSYHSEDKIIAISPNCVRCNLCVQECPVDAIESANIFRKAKIMDNCVKCEICVQTCPISCIKLINTSAILEDNTDFKYNLFSVVYPHRIIRMNDISVDLSKCSGCGNCGEFCPTNAIKMEFSSYFEDLDLDENKMYPTIKKDLCIGCGSCVSLCEDDAFKLDRTIGPILDTKNLLINQDICVNCYLCEENCPVEAIKLVDGKVVLNKDKCIRCNSCTDRCPVGALQLVNID